MTADAGADAGADERWMAVAVAVGARGLGAVWPNPAVGCVLVRDGAAVGRGWTGPGGRPHAEAEALRRAGAAADGATAYVSLEPCNHRGRGPPCAEALIAAGVRRCVFAMRDPDPRVSGRGAARLAEAGLAVAEGVGAEAAGEVHRGYVLHRTEGRPLVVWKVASTLDGRIAARDGGPAWITGPEARAWGHMLRARHDAILVGARTAALDRPRLTCRLPGLEGRSPVRVAVDSRLRLPLEAPPLAGGGAVWVVCRADADRVRIEEREKAGVSVIAVAPDGEGVSMRGALAALAERGITRLLVEGGGRIAASLLRAGLVDRIEWFRAPVAVGGDGAPAAAPFGVGSLDGAARFRRTGLRRLGSDVLESLRPVS